MFVRSKDKELRKVLNHKAFARKVGELNLPLIIIRSRTGGIHCYHFVSQPIPASEMVKRLSEWSDILGHNNAEIFPKQTNLDEGMTGNWINLPYYKGNERYGFDDTGKALSLNGFLNYVQQIKNMDVITIDIKKDLATKAPPCLNILYLQGIPEGERNEAMFSFAIFCKKAYGENWKEIFYQINFNKVRPPLSVKELGNIARSVNKKDYRYKCKGEPLKSLCNAGTCLKKEFGIEEIEENKVNLDETTVSKQASTGFSLGELTKINANPPYYILEVNDKEVTLTAGEFMSYGKAQVVIMATIDRMPPKMKASEWRDLMDIKMLTMVIEEPPPEIDKYAFVLETIEEFTSLGNKLPDREMLYQVAAKYEVKGQWYIGFQLKNLEQFMRQKKLPALNRGVLYTLLKKGGFYPAKIRSSEGLLSVWQTLTVSPEAENEYKKQILI